MVEAGYEYGEQPGINTLVQRAKIAEYVIWAVLGIFALVLIGELLEVAGVIDLEALQLDLLASIYSLVLIASSVVFLASVVVVCMWIHRAHANLHELGHEGLEYTPGWAIGWYFIPIANLFKPFQAMRELWSESHSLTDNYSDVAPGNLGLWWAMWIIGNILGNISTRMYMFGDGSNLDVALFLGMGSTITTIGSAWLLLQIIRAVTAAQVAKTSLSEVFE